MCYYSVETGKQRKEDAIAGEPLVLTNLGTHGSKGFASPADTKVAVCIKPDTPLMLRNVPVNNFGIGPDITVVFVMMTQFASKYDGIRLENGDMVSLLDLPVGLTVDVLSKEIAAHTPQDPPSIEKKTPLKHRVTALIGSLLG